MTGNLTLSVRPRLLLATHHLRRPVGHSETCLTPPLPVSGGVALVSTRQTFEPSELVAVQSFVTDPHSADPQPATPAKAEHVTREIPPPRFTSRREYEPESLDCQGVPLPDTVSGGQQRVSALSHLVCSLISMPCSLCLKFTVGELERTLIKVTVEGYLSCK